MFHPFVLTPVLGDGCDRYAFGEFVLFVDTDGYSFACDYGQDVIVNAESIDELRGIVNAWYEHRFGFRPDDVEYQDIGDLLIVFGHEVTMTCA